MGGSEFAAGDARAIGKKEAKKRRSEVCSNHLRSVESVESPDDSAGQVCKTRPESLVLDSIRFFHAGFAVDERGKIL